MAKWIKWRDMFEERMKDPVEKERFENGYAEFSKRVDAELAAERAQAVFSGSKKRTRVNKLRGFNHRKESLRVA